jgi:hypothetical protein
MCKTLLPQTQIVLFHKIHVFPFLLKCIFFLTWMILPLQNALRSWVFHSQANSVHTVSNVLDHKASNIDGFITSDTVLLPFTRMELFCTNVMFQQFTMQRHRKINFQKVPKFSQGNNVQDPPVSDIMVYFQETECFFYSQDWGYFAQKWCFVNENPERLPVFTS